jgi:DNA-binding MarR family transcriptional regulator
MSVAQDLFFSQQALLRLFAVTNNLQMQGDRYLQDLTIRQMLAIPAIIHAPEGGASIADIARSLGTSKQSAKQIVNVLEKKGYIATAPGKHDKRALDITITSEGEQAFKLCSERTDEFLADIFNGFTSRELETFCKLLEKLYRFDGHSQPNAVAGADSSISSDTDEASILQHHQHYIDRRTTNRDK